MESFKNTWVEGIHYDVIPQSEISKINKKISENSTLNVNYKPERSYSEEDMKLAFTKGHDSARLKGSYKSNGTFEEDWILWFEQFKKK